MKFHNVDDRIQYPAIKRMSDLREILERIEKLLTETGQDHRIQLDTLRISLEPDSAGHVLVISANGGKK